MKTSRRRAQLGLVAALVLMAVCLGVLLVQGDDADARTSVPTAAPTVNGK